MSEENSSHPHTQLGFEKHMPGVSPYGEGVSVLTPEQERRENAVARLESAERRLEVIAEEVGVEGLDSAVAGYVEAVSATDVEPINQLEGAEVGVSEIITYPKDSVETAGALNNVPTEVLGEVLREVEAAAGDEAVEMIIDAVEDNDGAGKKEHVREPIEVVSSEQIAESFQHIKGEVFRYNHALSLLQMEMRGEATFDDDALKEIASHTTLEMLLGKKYVIDADGKVEIHASQEALHLANRIAARPFEDKELHMHLGAVRILSVEVGSSNEWRQRLNAGEQLPDAVRTYAELRQFPGIDFFARYRDEILPDVKESLDTSKSLKERRDLQEKFRTEASKTINALYGIEDWDDAPEQIKQMVIGFKQGDIKSYGYNKGEQGVFNIRGVEAICGYISNVNSIGSDNAAKLNGLFGTINFASYKRETLSAVLNYVENPTAYPSVDIIIRGQNGDHNGAFHELLRNRELVKTLVFEIGRPQEIEVINALLDKNGTAVGKVTLAGHGGRDGLRLSPNCLIGRMYEGGTRSVPSSLVRVMERITPDDNGDKPVVLSSCSQGRRYNMGATPSLADTISYLIPGSRVEAAPRVSYFSKVVNGAEGDVQVLIDKHYELAEILKKYEKYPGVGFLIGKLTHRNRMRQGSVEVHNGRRRRDNTGIVNIGA